MHNPHYDASYFAWQRSAGQFVADLESWKFTPFVAPNDIVLDFGCGGGYILAALACRERYGVEVNRVAREEAARLVKVHASVDELPSNVLFDLIISHHALEHVDDPLGQLRQMSGHLRVGGKMVFVVPSEIWPKQRQYRAADINQHLYTWTPMSLGNLFTRAGLIVERVELLPHRLLPKTTSVRGIVPTRIFHFWCNLWGLLTWTRQIRIVASKSDAVLT